MSQPIAPFEPIDCKPLWQILQEERQQIITAEMIAAVRERLYIERRLAENGIDIDELEQAG